MKNKLLKSKFFFPQEIKLLLKLLDANVIDSYIFFSFSLLIIENDARKKFLVLLLTWGVFIFKKIMELCANLLNFE